MIDETITRTYLNPAAANAGRTGYRTRVAAPAEAIELRRAAAAANKMEPAAGREGWCRLHTHAIITPAGMDDSFWLATFAKTIPCGSCRDHWLEWVAAYPPLWAPNFDYFAWTVAGHNAVNARLEKPYEDLMAARAYWLAKAARNGSRTPPAAPLQP